MIWWVWKPQSRSTGCCSGNVPAVGDLWPELDRLVHCPSDFLFLPPRFCRSGGCLFSSSNTHKRTETSTYTWPTSALHRSVLSKDTQRLCFGQRCLSLYLQVRKISVPGLNKFLDKWILSCYSLDPMLWLPGSQTKYYWMVSIPVTLKMC